MTLGGDAREAWDRLIRREPSLRRITRIEAPHPALRGLTRGGRQTADVGRAALTASFAEAARVLRLPQRAVRPEGTDAVRPTAPDGNQGSSWTSLVRHGVCARCGVAVNEPHHLHVVHKGCLLRGLSAADLADGKRRPAVHHDMAAGTASCEVCQLNERPAELLDVLMHPGCLDRCRQLAAQHRPKRPNSSKGPNPQRIETCPSCGRPIKPGGKCGCL